MTHPDKCSIHPRAKDAFDLMSHTAKALQVLLVSLLGCTAWLLSGRPLQPHCLVCVHLLLMRCI